MSWLKAIYAFCAWLTTREEVTKLGSSEDCAPIVDKIKIFTEYNNLPEITSAYPKNFNMPLEDYGTDIFNAVFDVIKFWDINTGYGLSSGSGRHVQQILDKLKEEGLTDG